MCLYMHAYIFIFCSLNKLFITEKLIFGYLENANIWCAASENQGVPLGFYHKHYDYD